MDKNAIKKYAIWARRELISRVSQKALQYGITDKEMVPANAASVNGVVLSADEMKQRRALIERIHTKGYEQTIEEVAYTWFNRFIALRFMEVNGYLPSRVRVFTDENNAFNPQILTEAIHLDMDGLDMEKVYGFKDANDKDGLFKYLLIVQCNALSPILPGMFQRIADETELLFPDNLLREGSVIEQMITQIDEEDWKDAVQIIGWLYQYYNSEKKDEVFAALKKNVKITKENIPAATQLFTPDWIVRYMVENSLGRLWLEGHPDTKDQLLPTREEQSAYAAGNRDPEDTKWHYYLEEAEQEPDVQAQLAQIRKEYAALTPEQIKVIDACCGSGHILAYMFDVLMQIYEVYGYSVRDAVRSIVENNIYGLDIDDRAAQLAYFAVMMKACQYDRRFLTRKDEDDNPYVPQLHVYAIVESNDVNRDSLKYFGWSMSDTERNMALSQLTDLLDSMQDAKEYGSILVIKDYDWELLYRFVGTVAYTGQLDFDTVCLEKTKEELWNLVKIAAILAQKYDAVVTNPPYMSINGMMAKQGNYLKKYYPNSKSDMSTVFMEKTVSMCKSGRYMAMINIPVWMFISSFEQLRKILIENQTLINMVHPGRGIFGSDFGTTAFVFRKGLIGGYIGHYRRLYDAQGEVETVDMRERQFLEGKGKYFSAQYRYTNIPGWPFAYWLTENYIKCFERKSIGEQFVPKFGMSTGDGDRFIRFWYETDFGLIDFMNKCEDDANYSKGHWVPIDKGGAFRRWYGNQSCVVWWKNNGSDIRQHPKAAVRSPQYFFTPHISWTLMTMGAFSARFFDSGFAIDTASNCVYFNGEVCYELIGFMNSKVAADILSILNPTINFSCGVISLLPFGELIDPAIGNTVKDCIKLAKQDWDSFETSWDFRRHPLISVIPKNRMLFDDIDSIDLAECFMCWENECETRFQTLKANEEELNRIFIDIYGLQDELTPEVEDRDVTVRRADLQRDVKSLISYAVGCMFGRYSLNKPGLVYAGGNWEDSYRRNALADENGDAITFGGVRIVVDKEYQIQVDGQWRDCTYSPDADNIIPICDDEYFEDDIVGRFIKFIETVYGKQSLEANLRFIADALGGKGQPKEVIRSYFLNDFFNDHCKIYQKRPIYWQFDSGKKNGFKCLIYMHRYREDTIARIRTDYVHEQQSRYRTAIAGLEQRMASASTAERVKLTKQLKKLQEQAEEIHVYEEKIHHLADQMIPIDLDDGVKVNYAKFQDVLAKIK